MLGQCSKPASSPPAAPAGEKTAVAVPALLDAAQAGRRRLFSEAGLAPFFAALTRLQDGQDRHPLRIIQIGDSHTANDAFSSRMREVLQAHFGAAGRGWLPPGIPFRYYRPRLVEVSASGWRQQGPGEAGSEVPLGLDAMVAESEHAGATMRLRSTEPQGFDRFGLEFLARPGGPPIEIDVDRQRPITIATAAAETRARRVVIPVEPGTQQVEVRAPQQARVELLGWNIERDRPGIIYENHGTIGATVALLGRINRQTVAAELSHSRPALLVVAFGTNEGFHDALVPADYAAQFRRQVAALHALAPDAAILVLGPPDGNRLVPSCPRTEARQDLCITGEEPASAPACVWRIPPKLAVVRGIQQRLAKAAGWAFWNWSRAMGGPCSMHRLYLRDPPLAFADHVHLNGAGYAASADVLLFDLLSAYHAWKSGHGQDDE